MGFKDPATHGTPDDELTFPDPEGERGTLTRRVWRDLHREDSGDAPLTVVGVEMERLPRRDTPPARLWLAWTGAALPDDLTLCWHWYGRRFAVEHGCRFAKQDLGWTTVRRRDPAAERWTWLLALVFWQLWLARALALDQRLPWERPLPPPDAGPPRSPGHRRGQRPKRHERHAVYRRQPKPAKPRRRQHQQARRRTATQAKRPSLPPSGCPLCRPLAQDCGVYSFVQTQMSETSVALVASYG